MGRSQVINADPNPIGQRLKPHDSVVHPQYGPSAIREVSSQRLRLDLPFRAMNFQLCSHSDDTSRAIANRSQTCQQ